MLFKCYSRFFFFLLAVVPCFFLASISAVGVFLLLDEKKKKTPPFLTVNSQGSYKNDCHLVAPLAAFSPSPTHRSCKWIPFWPKTNKSFSILIFVVKHGAHSLGWAGVPLLEAVEGEDRERILCQKKI